MSTVLIAMESLNTLLALFQNGIGMEPYLNVKTAECCILQVVGQMTNYISNCELKRMGKKNYIENINNKNSPRHSRPQFSLYVSPHY